VRDDDRVSLTWTEARPGLWRSDDGRYAIVRSVLPEDRPEPNAVYVTRKISAVSVLAWPGTLGYFLAERYSLPEARQCAEQDAWRDAQGDACNVPADFPALALGRFWWPISDGTTGGALAVVEDGDRVVARVIGMCRSDRDVYEPSTYAGVDVSSLMRALRP
jgi:hypothetical protein